jgi:hypothetical protein
MAKKYMDKGRGIKMSLKDVKIKKPFPMKIVQIIVVLLLLSSNILLVKIFNMLN